MRRPPRDRGFALIIVLWAVVLLTLLVTQLTVTGRTELQLAANLRAAAAVEAAADGAVHEAVFHLLDNATRWPADGLPHGLVLPGGNATVRITDEGGKVNPNLASPELLRALLRRAGAEEQDADGLALAIVGWRSASRQGLGGDAPYRAAGRDYGPANAPFRSVAELGAVLGVTPGLLTRLQPAMSVHSDTDPVAAVAPPLVRQTLADMQGAIPAGRPPPPRTVVVTAEVVGAGARFTRRAVVRLGLTEKEAPFQILTWEALPSVD